MTSRTLWILGSTIAVSLCHAQQPAEDPAARFKRMSREAEERGLAEPFRGITTDGKVVPGLFPLRSTGVSTEPAQKAATAFLAGLTEEQRKKTLFAVDDDEWRKWMNPHFYIRQGVSFAEMTEAQRELAFSLLKESLSAKGFKTSRDIMKLNDTLAELTGKFDEYGQWLYHLTVMGTPSATEPWGWQLDGHHLNINYFVLGDQVVMTPTFMGSEPVRAEGGKHAGTVILQEEQDKGAALMRALDAGQQSKALIKNEKGPVDNLAEAFKDNLVLEKAGIRYTDLRPDQQQQLRALIAEYVANMKDGHAKVKMTEVEAHLDDTWFAWIGDTGPESVFYYRIQSPVILIEFDHQRPIALDRSGKPSRKHIHTVVRTPNGNDYGKDLLRQHYEKHPHHRHEKAGK
jgi:hypothetical protein